MRFKKRRLVGTIRVETETKTTHAITFGSQHGYLKLQDDGRWHVYEGAGYQGVDDLILLREAITRAIILSGGPRELAS